MTDNGPHAIERANFAQLESDFYYGAVGVRRAVGIYNRHAGKNDKALSRLLRHHSEKAFTDEETWDRDGFDSLLSFYSLLELGCLAGYLRSPLTSSRIEKAYQHLTHPALRRYYEHHYRLLLPTAFRLRLEGSLRIPDQHSETSYESFVAFLEISRPIELGASVETFLWFLDGGWRGDYDIDDTVAAIRDPQQYLKSLGSRRKTHLQKSVVGFGEFLRFCKALHRLLEQLDDRDNSADQGIRLLRSGYWHFHSYWFRGLRKQMGRKLTAALDAFEMWEVNTNAGNRGGPTVPEEAAHRRVVEYRKSRETMKLIIAQLMSEENGHALRDAVKGPHAYKMRP